VKAYRNLRTVLSDTVSNMESLIAFLGQLEDDERLQSVSGDILVCAKDKLHRTNEKLIKLREKLTGSYRGIWSFLIAVEPLHKHLELCSLAFRGIEMQHNLQESINEAKTFVITRHHPRPDVALTPEMVPVNMIQFEVSLAHKSLYSRIKKREDFFAFQGILYGDLIKFLNEDLYSELGG